MTIQHRLVTAVALGGLFCACSGAPPVTPQNGPKPAPADQKVAADGEGDAVVAGAPGTLNVDPVKAPGETVLHFRWANPGITAATLAGYANLPESQVNSVLDLAVREMIAEGLSGKVDVDKFAGLVRTDAPIDVVVIADMDGGGQVPDPMLALSIGLSSLDGALGASKGTPRKIGDGVWEIGTQDKWGEPCAVAAASGKAPARLVCSERKKHMEKVAAFVARNIAAKADPAHDLSLEVSVRGLLDKYGNQWANQAKGLPVLIEEARIGVPKFDQALMDVADALANEAGAMIHDADSFRIEVGLDETKGAHVAMKASFAGQQSWLVQTMIDGAQNAGPAPDLVWKLPEASDFVTWGRSGDPKRFEGAATAARAMLEGWLEKQKVGSAADRKAIASLIRITSTEKFVPTVVAGGHFAKVNTAPTSIKHVVDDVVGWYLFGIDEKPTEMKKWLQDAVKTYNRPSLQKLLKDELGPDEAKNLPKLAVRNLGRGGLAIEATIPKVDDPFDQVPPDARGNAKKKTVDLKLHLMMMADGDRTWVGVAANKVELAKLMAGVKGAPSFASLAKRTDLARLKSESHAGGMFTSLQGVVGVVRPIVYALMVQPNSGPSKSLGTKVLEILEKMPNKGKTPILMFADIADGPRPSVSWSMEVPRGTLEDVGFVIENGMRLGN